MMAPSARAQGLHVRPPSVLLHHRQFAAVKILEDQRHDGVPAWIVRGLNIGHQQSLIDATRETQKPKTTSDWNLGISEEAEETRRAVRPPVQPGVRRVCWAS
ncbi:hypothetical protein DHEL01_v203865 [Diaporthe helianthi]|uniref:Uncharacterized protein n=1 Tax=Diaporthe helianthi TaxID=158607 RepID=A0A2P5I5J3_DIAHE|nr:hypothetical protein DHEL01_v203865 [Diaporthe helianthi]